MGTWSDSQFDEAFRKKYEVMGQQANADTTRANAVAQDVDQRPGMQAAADAAAMARAQLGAQTQKDVASMQDAGATSRASMQESGSMARSQLGANTQKEIASNAISFDREKLQQQGSQFDKSLGLQADTAMADDIIKRRSLTRPTTIYDDDGVKRSVPGVKFDDPIGSSPLDKYRKGI